tara:strand:- start:1090 stop:1284 length:195 start_codon:yes stop_codon:yes gene_type:complete
MSSEHGGAAPWDDGKDYCICGELSQSPDELCGSCEMICPKCGEDKEDSRNALCDECVDLTLPRN